LLTPEISVDFPLALDAQLHSHHPCHERQWLFPSKRVSQQCSTYRPTLGKWLGSLHRAYMPFCNPHRREQRTPVHSSTPPSLAYYPLLDTVQDFPRIKLSYPHNHPDYKPIPPRHLEPSLAQMLVLHYRQQEHPPTTAFPHSDDHVRPRIATMHLPDAKPSPP